MEEEGGGASMALTNPASRKTKIHKMVALSQSVPTLNMLDTTCQGLGRDGAGLAEVE